MTRNYKITTTGHIYDFARTVENLTDHPLYFTLDEENTDAEFDEEGSLISGNIVYRECDKEDAEDYSDSFVIPAHDWAGLNYNEIIM